MQSESISLNENTQSGGTPLLACLAEITRFYKKPMSEASLCFGLPGSAETFSSELFIRAARRAGYRAEQSEYYLSTIPEQVMPVVLLLGNDSACILLSKEGDDYRVLMAAEPGSPELIMSRTELESCYSGECLLIQPDRHSDNRDRNPEYLKVGKHWFWSTMWRFKSVYLEVMVAAALINVFALASSLFVMNVYDRVVPNEAFETLWVLAFGVGIALFFDFILKIVRSYYVDRTARKVDLLLGSQLFAQVMNLKMSERSPSAGVQANEIRELEGLRDFFTSATLATLSDLPFIVFFIGVIYLLAGEVAYVPLIALVLMVSIGLIAQIPQSRLMKQYMRESSIRHGVLVEALKAIQDIKILGAQGNIQSRWEDSAAYSGLSMSRNKFYTSTVTTLFQLISQSVMIGVVVWGVYKIAEGDLTMGGLVACSMLSGRVSAPLMQFSGLLLRYQHAKLSYIGLNALMNKETERPEGKTFLQRPVLKGDIDISDLNFRYNEDGPYILKDLNLHIKQGEKIGILGRVGSGKTTILSLLSGFYEPESGLLQLDGSEISQIDPADLRANTVYMAQEANLLFGSLRENLTLGTTQVSDERIIQICEMVGLDRLVSQHPAGLDLPIGEQGAGLSGGQQQAVALARVLLSGGNICMLDEPTANLDPNTETRLLQGLKEEFKDKTLLMATHQPSSLALVDRLIVVDQGRVVMDGPKEEIIQALQGNAQPSKQEAS